MQNIYKILKKNDVCLCSVPFNFHIHDEPNDFYRFTHYGLKFLFRDFKHVEIKRRNGWLSQFLLILLDYILKKIIFQSY